MKHGDLTSEQASKFIEAVCSNETKMRDLLSLPFDRIPTDIPQIEYLKEDQHYYPLNQLSVGQKCTALLLIALSEGSMPIVVDQPEDALDVATVYYDVVSRLRNRKESRQFILTTHNANIAVTSDSDKYHVLKATESRGEIVCCGAIDLDNVRSAVIDHLEGGIGPYTLRGKKYELAE
jgi:Fe-S cluster assembly ATPase SufC